MSNVKEMKLEDLSYHILPSKRFAGSSFSKLHDNVFNFFVRRWEEAFNNTKDQGTPAHGWEDHFLKQDIVTAITCKDEVVAAHLYTVYDLSAASTRKSEYFSFFPQTTIPELIRRGIQNVTSMEYLCVDESVKRNTLELSLGKTILGLGGYLTENKGLDASIGTPLAGNKVDIMMENVGGVLLEKGIKKYGFPVDLLFIPTKPCHPGRDPKTREVMTTLWNRRLDYTKEFYSKFAA
ncbi:MAG: hypothetical protein AAGB31_11220 [Bdellovibrio sp.]